MDYDDERQTLLKWFCFLHLLHSCPLARQSCPIDPLCFLNPHRGQFLLLLWIDLFAVFLLCCFLTFLVVSVYFISLLTLILRLLSDWPYLYLNFSFTSINFVYFLIISTLAPSFINSLRSQPCLIAARQSLVLANLNTIWSRVW